MIPRPRRGGKEAAAVAWLLVMTVAWPSFPGIGLAAEQIPLGLEPRPPWTASRVVGSPDPPLPYTTEPVYTNITWQAPLYIEAEPGTDQLVVILQGGEPERPSRIVRLREDPAADQVTTLLEMSNRLIYGLTFHPGYLTNGHVYVFSNGRTGASERTNRISRFTVSRAPPQACDPSTERLIIQWPSSGHDGGDLVFGHDGMLYIATGDGTSDSDGRVTGQDLSDLAGGVLRIDVDHPDPDRAYSVPGDNPFWQVPGARPELWAYGLRNPWRMTVDSRTGHLWAGNNGQDLWETAHLVRSGENYGWSVYEGSHPFYLNRPRGPTPVVAPTIEHPHSEFRSLTGGVVYYGQLFPALNGVYLYGDYSTGRIWGGRHDGHRLVWHRELADTALQIVGFGLGHRGDLLILDLGGGIHRFKAAPPEPERAPFPTRLTETGLFLDVAAHQPHPALVPYSVNAQGWVDGAKVERWIALPNETRLRYASSGPWESPEGAVLMQTLTVPAPSGPGRTEAWRRVETRLLTFQQGQWNGYSYRWNADQSDAILVPASGTNVALALPDAAHSSGGTQARSWRFPSRSECLTCHSRAAGFVLGLTTMQLNRDRDYGGLRTNQLRALSVLGVLDRSPDSISEAQARLVDPYDPAQDLTARARSYLHVNCSVCHVEAGGGNSQMNLRFGTRRENMKVLETRPLHDSFGIRDAMIIAPGNPARSVLHRRISQRGPGQMPPLVSTKVDTEGARLIHDWICSMPVRETHLHAWTMEQLEPALGDLTSGRSMDSGRNAFRDAGCIQCHRFEGEGGSVGPNLTGIGRRLDARALLESILLPSKVIATNYAVMEIELDTGVVHAGRIEREDEHTLLLSPLSALGERVSVEKEHVRLRRISPVSNMPAGLLDALNRDQILDLLAYLLISRDPSGRHGSR